MGLGCMSLLGLMASLLADYFLQHSILNYKAFFIWFVLEYKSPPQFIGLGLQLVMSIFFLTERLFFLDHLEVFNTVQKHVQW